MFGWVVVLLECVIGEFVWVFFGLLGFVFVVGLVVIWLVIGCVFGIVVVWVIFVFRLRREVEKYDVLIFVDYIVKRYFDVEKWIRIFGSLMIVFFFFFYVGV